MEAGRLTGDLRTGGRTTRSPVHGCLPPPSKGGSKGLGRGIASTQHTILRWNQQLPTPVYLLSEHIILDVDVQLFDTYPRTPRARVSLQLRQSEMKMLSRERYTELRHLQRGTPPPFVACP